MWQVNPDDASVVACTPETAETAAPPTGWHTLQGCLIAPRGGKMVLAAHNRHRLCNAVAAAQHPHANTHIFRRYLAALNDPAEHPRVARGVLRVYSAPGRYTEYYVHQAKLLHENIFCAHATAHSAAAAQLAAAHGFVVPRRSAVARHIRYCAVRLGGRSDAAKRLQITAAAPHHIAAMPHTSHRMHLPHRQLGDVAPIAALLCLVPLCARACVDGRYDAVAHLVDDVLAHDDAAAARNAPAAAAQLRAALASSPSLLSPSSPSLLLDGDGVGVSRPLDVGTAVDAGDSVDSSSESDSESDSESSVAGGRTVFVPVGAPSLVPVGPPSFVPAGPPSLVPVADSADLADFGDVADVADSADFGDSADSADAASLIAMLAAVFARLAIPHTAVAADTLLLHGGDHGAHDYLVSTRSDVTDTQPALCVGCLFANRYYDNGDHNSYSAAGITTEPPPAAPPVIIYRL